MANRESTPERVRGDLASVSHQVTDAENRSETEQVTELAVGMQVEAVVSERTRRVLAVAAGETQFSTLDRQERSDAHAMVDSAIAERAAASSFGDLALQDGHRAVCLDVDGHLVEISPDGSRCLP